MQKRKRESEENGLFNGYVFVISNKETKKRQIEKQIITLGGKVSVKLGKNVSYYSQNNNTLINKYNR